MNAGKAMSRDRALLNFHETQMFTLTNFVLGPLLLSCAMTTGKWLRMQVHSLVHSTQSRGKPKSRKQFHCHLEMESRQHARKS